MQNIILTALLLLVSWAGLAQDGLPPTQTQTPEKTIILDAEGVEFEDQFVEGIKFCLLEEYEKALPIFEKLQEKYPTRTAITYQIANIYFKQSFYEKALPQALQTLRLDPDNAHHYILVADIYEAQQDYKQAAEMLEKLLEREPFRETVYYDLAVLYLYQEKYDETIETYNRAEKQFGLNEMVVRHKQKIYLSIDNFKGALAEGKKLIQEFPKVVDYYVSQASLCLANGYTDEAHKLLTEALKIDNTNPQLHLHLAEIYTLKGEKAKSHEAMEYAFGSPLLEVDAKLNFISDLTTSQEPEDLDLALKLMKMAVLVHDENATVHITLGDLLKNKKDFREARKIYLTALELDADNYRVWEEMMQLDLELNQYDSLARHSEKALEYFPNHAVFWFYNGSANLILKKYQKAIEALEQTRSLAQGNVELQYQAYAQLGDSYNGIKEYELADQAYEKALTFKPNDLYVLNNYSYFLALRKEKLELAKKMADDLARLSPTNATYLDTYAWVLFQAGEYAKALPYIEKAIVISPKGVILEHYGDVLFKLGRIEEATEQWNKAKKAGGSSEQIDRKITEKKIIE